MKNINSMTGMSEVNNVRSDIAKTRGTINRVASVASQFKGVEEAQLVEGRKGYSEFTTALISRIGSSNINTDYTGYIELDDCGCWIIADGIDGSKEAAATSKLCVESIIQKFIEKPKFSRRFVKKLLYLAHNEVQKYQNTMSKKLGVGSSITVIITDYSSVIMGSLGNTRGAILRDELVYKKTRDHNIAHLIYENGDLSYDSIRFNNQKNKLTQYAGTYGGINPFISRKIDLMPGDKLLIMSEGAWENLDESDIEIRLSQSERVGKWIGGLEGLIRDKSGKKLENYSLIGIFVDKLAPKKKRGKKALMIFMIILPFIIMLSYMGYRVYALKKERANVYRDIGFYEKRAKGELNNKLYLKALEDYKQAKGKYKLLYIKPSASFLKKNLFPAEVLNKGVDNEIENIDQKIKELELIVKLQKDRASADEDYKNNKFQEAIDKYKAIEVASQQMRVLDATDKQIWAKEIRNSITNCEGLIQGMKLNLEGDRLAKEKDEEGAIRNYLEAKVIFMKYNRIDLVTEVSGKAEELKKKRDKISKEALELEKQGIRMERKDIDEAIAYYEMAINAYGKLGDFDKQDELAEKIEELRDNRDELKSEKDEYMSEAKAYAKEGRYDEALANVKKAQKSSDMLNDNNGMTDSLEKEGDLLFEKENYDEAGEKYAEAYENSLNSNNRAQQKALEEKQQVIKTLKKGKKLEKEGDELFRDKEYKEAKLKFREAKDVYKKLEDSDYFKEDKYDEIMKKLKAKEKKAWKKSNWIPFF